jgi:hypothetical protein
MKKPTGRTGENNDRIHQCILIKKKIMKKTHSGILGLSSDSNATPSANEDSPGGEESEGGGIMGNDLFREDLADDVTSTVPAPSPLRRSPRRFPPPSPTDGASEVPVQQPVDEVP